MIERTQYSIQLTEALKRSPAVALLGPRQCGKTTLAREIGAQKLANYFDLESPRDQLRLQNPEMELEKRSGLVVLDEIQTFPELFPILRSLIDRNPGKATYLLLGSASPTLLRSAGESLAGRVEFIDLHGFDLSETGWGTTDKLWVRGGFPLSFLAETDADSVRWREGFIRTFLQRDLPQFGIQVPEPTMRRFWLMLAHTQGQVLNSSNLARSMGLTDKTIRHYVDHLEQTYMVRVLLPWFENLKKRQVKSPKVYLRDTGILHSLLTIGENDELLSHPIAGASWEGFVIEQLIRIHRFSQAYFWATHASAELDLFVFHHGKRYGFEIKRTERPKVTASMRTAIRDLGLHVLFVIYPGSDIIQLEKNMYALGLCSIKEIFSMDV